MAYKISVTLPGTDDHGSESIKSQPLTHQGISTICFLFFKIYLFLLHWVFIVECCGECEILSSRRCKDFSLQWLLLWNSHSRARASVVTAGGLSCPGACGIFPVHGLNPCPLHWQMNSQAQNYQGSPSICFLMVTVFGHQELSHQS